MKTAFFAYSGYPTSAGDTIEDAIKQINISQLANITSWRQYNVNGQLIINMVTDAIDNADIFCADLTGFSDNVLFEIGYAIAKNKPLFLLLDTSHIESYQQYKEFNSLTTFGYAKYRNNSDIVFEFNHFIQNGQPSQITKNMNTLANREPLLFLKNQTDNDYSRILLDAIKHKKIPYSLDDASETPLQPINWYLEKLTNAVLIELSSTSRQGYKLQNSKCSLIAGLALGYNIDVFMIVEEPFDSPIDYRDILIKYKNKEECKKKVNEFLDPLKNKLLEYNFKKAQKTQEIKEKTAFQKIRFGEFLAENEQSEISDYYVEIFPANDLIKNDYNIIIGRKGIGKTATLYYLKNILETESSNRTRNHVFLIKPGALEISGLVKILQASPEEYERSHLLESTWEFLIYTEIARLIYFDIKDKPLYSVSSKENEFKTFIEEEPNLFFDDFSERLETGLKTIQDSNIRGFEDISSFKIKVAEALHSEILIKIRKFLSILFSENDKIFLLIDNLDKSWKRTGNLNLQSEWILGLISVTPKIARELFSFRMKGSMPIHKRKPKLNNALKNIDFHLSIFLRSDIFRYMLRNTQEPDKIEFINLLKLNTKDVLFRIIEERFQEINRNLFDSNLLVDQSWEKFVIPEIDNILIRDYIYDRIIPRPRDIIYFFIQAHRSAVMKDHSIIEAEDIQQAYKEYSNWVFTSVMVESDVDLEDFLYYLLNQHQIIDQKNLHSIFCESGLSESDYSFEETIDTLASLSIIGKETQENFFEFEDDFNSKKKIDFKFKRFNSNRYKIHNALVPCLELKQ